MNRPTRRTGLLLVITGAIFWGVGGTVAQKLFQQNAINVNWLVTYSVTYSWFFTLNNPILEKTVLRYLESGENRRTAVQLIIFGLLGMLAVQYTYMTSIKDGNAAVATLLQYLAPVMIIIYLILRNKL